MGIPPPSCCAGFFSAVHCPSGKLRRSSFSARRVPASKFNDLAVWPAGFVNYSYIHIIAGRFPASRMGGSCRRQMTDGPLPAAWPAIRTSSGARGMRSQANRQSTGQQSQQQPRATPGVACRSRVISSEVYLKGEFPVAFFNPRKNGSSIAMAACSRGVSHGGKSIL